MLTIAKESSNLIGLENFGKTGFSIIAGLEWYFLHQPKSDKIPAHQSLPHQIYTLLLLKIGH